MMIMMMPVVVVTMMMKTTMIMNLKTVAGVKAQGQLMPWGFLVGIKLMLCREH